MTNHFPTPGFPDVEGLLRQALAPVEPPEALAARLDATLSNLTELAAEELEAWELGAVYDPRNWTRVVRPVAAVAVGGSASAALVLLRVRAGRKRRKAAADNRLDYAEQTVRAVAHEARRLLDR